MTRPITILVCALGGEGGGVLAEWLYVAAEHAGLAAQCTSIPGVAQRTGATTYYVEIHPEPLAAGQRRPVFSLNPVPGALDLLVSSELLETARQVGAGLPSRERTIIVSSTARALTTSEKIQMTDGRSDDARLVAAIQQHARTLEFIDTEALARQAGTVVSAVLFGAIGGSGVLPFGREPCEAAIRTVGKGVESSLRGFALAHDALVARRAERARAEAYVAGVMTPTAARAVAMPVPAAAAAPALPAKPAAPAAPAAPPLPAPLRERFPAQVHELLAHAHARLVDYQDGDYAALYVARLARVLDAERAGDAAAAGDFATTLEATRWLALWMAFDDIVNVARLKLARSRMARVRREVGARDDEVVRVYDHFKPGVPELAGMLPQALANRLIAWDRKRAVAGREPWALPLALGTHGLFGVVALRMVAALPWLRRRSQRFALEQRLIERWLAAVERGAREHWALGHELACCGRLIKGYGSTNERGKDNLLHIIDQLATAPTSAAERTQSVRAARQAALADDAGRALDQVLVAHGAAPRAPREQVLRFYRRRPSA